MHHLDRACHPEPGWFAGEGSQAILIHTQLASVYDPLHLLYSSQGC